MTRPGTGQPATHEELARMNSIANMEEGIARAEAGINRSDVMAVVYALGDIEGVLMPFGDTLEANATIHREEMDEVTERIESAGYEVLGEIDGYEDSDTAYLRVAVEGGEGDDFDPEEFGHR